MCIQKFATGEDKTRFKDGYQLIFGQWDGLVALGSYPLFTTMESRCIDIMQIYEYIGIFSVPEYLGPPAWTHCMSGLTIEKRHQYRQLVSHHHCIFLWICFIKSNKDVKCSQGPTEVSMLMFGGVGPTHFYHFYFYLIHDSIQIQLNSKNESKFE